MKWTLLALDYRHLIAAEEHFMKTLLLHALLYHTNRTWACPPTRAFESSMKKFLPEVPAL